MQLTPYQYIDDLLATLLGKLQQILGKQLIGLYLYGSLVGGNFNTEISDIDLLAVTSTDIDEKEFGEIKKMQDEFVKNNGQWENRLEIAYLSRHALKTFKTETSRAAIISPGEPFHFKEAGEHWLIDWYFVREKGVTLFGPPPTALIAPISKKEFLQAVREYAQSYREWVKHQQNRNAQSYVILTLCRSLYAIENGEQASKMQAAVWAQRRFPQWHSLIKMALAWRLASHDDKAASYKGNMPKTAHFVRFAIEKIQNS
jgi:hypothetical protein